MTRSQQRAAVLIGVPGTILSVLALTGFFLRVVHNRLELPRYATIQAFYGAVGEAYGDGFLAGFSLCFFLVLLAVALGGARMRGRRRPCSPSGKSS